MPLKTLDLSPENIIGAIIAIIIIAFLIYLFLCRLAEKNEIKNHLRASLKQGVKDESPVVRCQVAESAYATQDMLDKLSDDPANEVRKAVARNCNVHENIMEKLAKDEDVEVRKTVLYNLRSAGAKLQMIHDEDPKIRASVIQSLETQLALHGSRFAK